MDINKTISFNLNITVEKEVVAYLSASISSGNYNISINANIVNKALADANTETVKAQYEEFELEVKTTAVELGYAIF